MSNQNTNEVKDWRKEIIMILDIEIYDDYGEHTWAQARFLVHGYNDVLWTNNLREALSFLRSQIESITKSKEEE